MKRVFHILKYFDIFGTKYTFYSNKKPKLYTVTGGILSIISIFFCILIPFILSLDDLKRKTPNVIFSTIFEGSHREIKFTDQKIWIPWRIIDYNYNKFVNHTGLLYPIINYIIEEKNEETKMLNLRATKLNYKLCNETYMLNDNNIYKMKIPLNEVYCIDLDDLNKEESWITGLVNFIQFDLYYCENGTNYDENNTKCTSNDKIINSIGLNNNLKIAFYFPIIQFQPTNKKNPVLVTYQQHSLCLSKYTKKLEKAVLKENIFTDDSGWILRKDSNSSYWGMNYISGDDQFIGSSKDFTGQESNSKIYSISIYLESDINHYIRYYKKLNIILAEAIPVALIIFFVFKHISKLFKFAERNKKIIELLFENLNEKPKQIREKIKPKNISDDHLHYKGRLSYKNNLFFKDDSKNKKKSKVSVDYVVNNKHDEMRSSIIINKKRSTNISLNNLNLKNKLFFQNKKNNNNNINDFSNQNLIFNESCKRKDFILNEDKNKNKSHKTLASEKKVITNNKSSINGKLFPYKYYLCSVFIKNINISKGNFFFSARFAKVYTFLCQLFDVTTYISLQREFSVLKNNLSEKNIKLIENYNKINVNSKNFLNEISYCIGEHKFNILAH